MLAGSTGLEPAASGVTGRRSNQLNYDPCKNLEFQTSEGRFRLEELSLVQPTRAATRPGDLKSTI